MPSAYTASLRLVLPVTGELTGVWGTTVNNGLTSPVEQAIAGTLSLAMADANHTLTTATEAPDEARNMFITLTGALTAQRNVVCPSFSKLYIVTNNTTGGHSINFKTAAGTGVLVPPGQRYVVYCNGVNVVFADTRAIDQGTELDVASAGTTDIGNVLTPFLRVTGTTTITSFGTGYRGIRYLRFAAALTLTHNATSLVLPGGVNITTAAGDSALFVPKGTPADGWVCVGYQRENGSALNGASAGAVGTSGLTMATARFLARSTAGTGAIEEKTAAEILTMLGIADQVAQPGDMKPTTRTTAPPGWMAMPLVPTNISRTTYASLFAAIGTTWGAGDGSTTFGCPYCPANHVPVQANGNVGTATNGAVIAHTHAIVVWGNNTTAGGDVHRGTGAAISAANTESTGGTANLAAGVRVLWCVKL